MQHPPLVVDLDGTLLRSDLLLETGLVFCRDQPLRFATPLRWLMRGKAALKHALADATEIDVAALPYDRAVIDYIKAARLTGRTVVLATASHHRLAEQVAHHLKLFDEVIASNEHRNLSGETKRDVLVAAFGEQGFDYVGNAHDDLPVWRSARQAVIVNAPAAVERKGREQGNVTMVIQSATASPHDWVRALRLHQWLKNLLVFVPLIAAHLYAEAHLVLDAVLAFVAFGLCASSVYVLNDLLDLRDDRHHPHKRTRPFAAGRLSIKSGLFAIPLLLTFAFALSGWMLPSAFVAGLAGYFALTLSYSLWLKRQMMIDVITLAVLYTLRIIFGALAIGVTPSFWLLAFSMFIFLSLAMVKRYAELFQVRRRNKKGKVRGRGYYTSDLSMIASLGAASGFIAVMVLALYINDPITKQLYRHPEFIWLACPLLLTWISRVWMLAHRGMMNEDPVIFAVRDRGSQLIGFSTALVFWMAI